MASIKSNIEIIGYASRLPGAADTNEFWNLLKEGRCSVTSVSNDRWPLARFGHPDRAAAGKAYTWAAGQLDDVWGFDPSFFGISPREALQIDPQQRILLQLVWEALEQAGLPPSALAGTSTGVYVGASSLDYHHRFVIDPPNADMQFMTGNTLSIVSNRISYIYDLRGPSFTVDTACSSSLVALHEAISALESGQIDTAIVCGVSMLLSPFSFVGFSRASMLSPTGLCQAFDANGDGYVRSEGGVVLVLQSLRVARANGTRVHGRILASGINADGRTVGLSLPSPYAQAALLAEMYGADGVDPNALAFVEAHGTGTRVGDPAEAEALGKVIGQKRDDVLHIGSVKTNVGHLEPVSGLVGLLKSLLALKHDELPRSLHFNTPNPDIAFDELNLKVASEPVALKTSGKPRLAGINSFGFGGTNAHVVIADGDREQPVVADVVKLDTPLVLSARGKAALGQLARRYRDALDEASDETAAQIAASAAYTRDLLGDRLVVLGATADERRRVLETFLADETCPNLVQGSTVKSEQKIAFVFSGNGSQWAGMGRDAYQKDLAFQQAFERVDRKFMGIGGWSLLTTLFSEDLENEIERTEIAQPLLFAVQVALVEALAKRGVRPAAVAGHSVGEVAAAWCSGALTLDQAVKVIHARSTRQEVIRDLGTMAALLLSAEEAQAAINEAGFPRIELAAINSPRSVTISGPVESLDAFGKYARKKRWAMKKLNLAYPFHCALVEPIREPLLDALDGVSPRAADVPFYSTVNPDKRDVALDPDYWWRNVRQPVLFSAAVEAMAADGVSVFVEIGPRPVLGTYMTDVLREGGQRADVLSSLDMPAKNGATSRNPVEFAAADVLAHGGTVDLDAFFGEAPAHPVTLPNYPWQNVPFKPEATPESVDYMFGSSWPLLGYRLRQDVGEWFNHVDPALLPWLGDHKVEESIVFPAAGYTEMALRAALRWSGAEEIELRDFDILRPLVFDGAETFETQVRISNDDRVVEVLSRPRLAGAEWALNARGHYVSAVRKDRTSAIKVSGDTVVTLDHDELYEVTRAFGLRYGPAFQRAETVVTHDKTTATVSLKPQVEELGEERFALCPTLMDAGFHGLFALLNGVQEIPDQTSFLPIRFGALRLLAPETAPTSVRIKVTKASPRSIEASFEYLDAEGGVVARLTQARFRAVRLGRETRQDDLAYRTFATLLADPARIAPLADVMPQGFAAFAQQAGIASDSDFEPGETLLLVEAMGRTIAHETLWRMAGGASFNADALVAGGKIAGSAQPLVHALLGWLTDSGLAEEQGDVTVLTDPSEGPATSDLLKTIALEASGHIAEASLLSRLHEGLEGLLARGLAEKASGWFASGLFEAYQTSSPAALARNEGLRHLADKIIAGWPKDQALRLLVLGADSPELLLALDRTCDPRRASVTVTDPVSTMLGRAERQWTGSNNVRFAAFDEADALAAAGPFDIILSGGSLTDRNGDDIAAVTKHLVQGGLLFSAEFVPSPLTDLLRGIGTDWWRETAVAGFPISRQRGADEWRSLLEGFGLEAIETVALASDVAEATLIGARAPEKAATETAAITQEGEATAELLVIADAEGDSRKLAEALKSTLAPRGLKVTVALANGTPNEEGLVALSLEPGNAETASLLKRATAGIVHLSGAFAPAGDALSVVDGRTWQLTRLLNSIGFEDTRLWIVAPGGMQDIAGGSAHRPDQAAVWAYGRVAMNEFANAGIRLIDLSPTLEPGVAAVRLADEILKSGEEREIIIDGRRRSGLRIVQGGLFADSAVSPEADPAMRLDILRQGSLDQLAWHAVDRKAPEGNEIEIAVEASGLNFRDVMWALGLLPEEALEDGFAGPTLGMECCGTVLSTGPGVTRFKAGDKVITFAPACFASHVTVSEDACAPMPSTVSSEEAATIPVTFLTAYYALVHLARLQEGETVLIHGGAGGVGLAALQIAKWRGARVITTAGSDEKRSFLKLLGADLVLDSRSLAFVDEVLAATDGEGVDVVLNSLFGEAMERSIEVLRPFGRFLELGKRDYYGNTRIGLRPFRQNLTYFGIDADQLLTRQPKLAKELFVELVRLFEAGTLAPLPYRVFEADGVVEAFRLMQQAGHIGKIILRPPHVPADVRRTRKLALKEDATYVVGGGFGGFGTELLRRMADLGARNLVVLSRRGGTSEEAAAVIGELAARGVTVLAPACDLTSETALSAALAEARSKLPPICGVFHTAMVLNDVLISNLDHDGLTRVLAPKVRGAELLDRLTASDPLDHFVVYSSATTLVGNPGQANYVAANGYLEALARKRRAEGKPGLAVAWGAISDAGYLARNEDVNELLSRKLGRHALTAREALDGLVSLMGEPQQDLETAAVGYARIDWQAARRDLALLATPLVELMGLGSSEDGAAVEGAIDLNVLLKGMDKVKAVTTVCSLLAGEIGKILRISPEEIDPHKPLSEVGMDSLMALELRMSAERQLGIDIPLMSLANGATLIDLATRVVNRVLGGESDSGASAEAQQLASQHVSEDLAEAGDLAGIAEQVEAKSREMRSLL